MENNQKTFFWNGLVIIGPVLYLLPTVALRLLLLIGEFSNLLFAFVIILWLILLWLKIEYKRQALFLGHTKECAERYSTIAAFAGIRGYNPTYGGLTKYKSAIRIAAERSLGKKRTKKTFRVATFLGIAVLLLLGISFSYDGLIRQREGLPDIYQRSEPVMSEATLAAFAIPIAALFIYSHFAKRTKRKSLLISMITAGSLLAWLVLIYALSIYARVSFWWNLLDSILVLIGRPEYF